MNMETHCYVAADPTQPGAAFAIAVDSADMQKHLPSLFKDWIKEGGKPTHVTLEEGRVMIGKWVRP